ncbi:hypothetical protein C8R45DRAFT_485619 [Mycena sanguinolenta]|nr:hypothetical protein C8R45DRAFT_485619 [Mycena sanguinolenta]
MNRYTHSDIPPDHLTPVYACVYDLSHCYFIKFDGKIFSKRVFPLVQLPSIPTEDNIKKYIREILPLHVFMFAVLLEGYVCSTGLHYYRAVQRRATEKPQTTNGWSSAFQKAAAARDHFRRAASYGDHKHAERGLSLLCSSLEAWPPVTFGEIKLLLPQTIESIVQELSETSKNESRDDPDPDWEPPTKVPPFDTDVKEAKQEANVAKFWDSLPSQLRRRFEDFARRLDNTSASYGTLQMIASRPEPEEWKQILQEHTEATSDEVDLFLNDVKAAGEMGLFI